MLQGPGASERGKGKRLGIGVVQRIQVGRGSSHGVQEAMCFSIRSMHTDLCFPFPWFAPPTSAACCLLSTHPQRYSQGSVFKRSVLDMIAEELMSSKDAEQERGCPIGQGAVPIITDPQVRGAGLGCLSELHADHCPLLHPTTSCTRPLCPASCPFCLIRLFVLFCLGPVQASAMEYLYEHLSMTDKSLVDREAVADGLEQLGELQQ